jgi:hypothetical protein
MQTRIERYKLEWARLKEKYDKNWSLLVKALERGDEVNHKKYSRIEERLTQKQTEVNKKMGGWVDTCPLLGVTRTCGQCSGYFYTKGKRNYQAVKPMKGIELHKCRNKELPKTDSVSIR